jgi:hypothetical protein
MELDVIITDSKDERFTNLTKLLDKDLNERYGELQKKYDKIRLWIYADGLSEKKSRG